MASTLTQCSEPEDFASVAWTCPKTGYLQPFTYYGHPTGVKWIHMKAIDEYKINRKTITVSSYLNKKLHMSNFSVVFCDLGFPILLPNFEISTWNHMKKGTFPMGIIGDDDRPQQKSLHFSGFMMLTEEQHNQMVSSPNYRLGKIDL